MSPLKVAAFPAKSPSFTLGSPGLGELVHNWLASPVKVGRFLFSTRQWTPTFQGMQPMQEESNPRYTPSVSGRPA